MAYTETQSVSWFGRPGSSFRGIGVGIVLIIAGTGVLWWNGNGQLPGGRMMRHWKKMLSGLVFFLYCCLLASLGFAASEETGDKSGRPSAQDVQNDVKDAMHEMISITGAVMSGMAEGMREGAEKAQEQLDSADGTRLVGNKKDLAELVQVKIFRLEDRGNGS